MVAIRVPLAFSGGALASVTLVSRLVAARQRAVRRRTAFGGARHRVHAPDHRNAARKQTRAAGHARAAGVATGADVDCRMAAATAAPASSITRAHRSTPSSTTAAFRVSGIDGDAMPLVRPTPDYPARAAAAGTEGWVQVQFSVTAAGTVRDAVVVASEPGTLFDEAALKAIARWRYNPRVVDGMAVERVGLQTVIRFELEN